MTRLSHLLPAVLCTVLASSVLPISAQQWAKDKLEQSSRHREYVTLTHDNRKVNAFVAYPEVKDKAPVVVLVHEIFGLSDWMKLEADELAARGYIVVVPDLVSGVGPNGGGTDALFATSGSTDAVVKAVTSQAEAQVMADLGAAADYGKKLPSANGRLYVAGFCWGGGKSFDFATHRRDLSAAFVFYGPPPPTADMAKINVPVYGFYAGNDARIGATVPQTVIDMKAAGKRYEPVTYDGAGHGFMRAGQAPDSKPADHKAWSEATERLLKAMQPTS